MAFLPTAPFLGASGIHPALLGGPYGGLGFSGLNAFPFGVNPLLLQQQQQQPQQQQEQQAQPQQSQPQPPQVQAQQAPQQGGAELRVCPFTGQVQVVPAGTPHICPVTGQILPCPQGAQQGAEVRVCPFTGQVQVVPAGTPHICPITGQVKHCPSGAKKECAQQSGCPPTCGTQIQQATGGVEARVCPVSGTVQLVQSGQPHVCPYTGITCHCPTKAGCGNEACAPNCDPASCGANQNVVVPNPWTGLPQVQQVPVQPQHQLSSQSVVVPNPLTGFPTVVPVSSLVGQVQQQQQGQQIQAAPVAATTLSFLNRPTNFPQLPGGLSGSYAAVGPRRFW